jgi:phytanoyl-CoA hydroxylase
VRFLFKRKIFSELKFPLWGLGGFMLQQYKKDGYLLLKGFFSKEEVNAIYEEAKQIFAVQIKRVLGKDVDSQNKTEFEQAMFEFFQADFEAFVGTGKNVQHTIRLFRLATEEKITKLLNELGMEHPVVAVRPAMQFNSRHLSKGGTHWKLGAHQDWRSGQGSLDGITLWSPLVDCDSALGVLQLVPGSHTIGLMDATGVSYEGSINNDFPDEKYMEQNMEVGDLLVFSAMLVHRSGDNVTDKIRWSIQLRYNNLADKTFIERGYPQAYIYKPQEEVITPNFPNKAQIAAVFE